jgi:hypothetical protein
MRTADGQTDITKRIGAFRNFANTPKKNLALIGAEFYGHEFALGL